MSDAVPIPPHPNLEQYKKLAKDLQRASESKDAAAVRDWAEHWRQAIHRLQSFESEPEIQKEIDESAARIEQRWKEFKEANARPHSCTLTDCQFFIARVHGFASWPKFQNYLRALSRANSRVSTFEAAADLIVSGEPAKLKQLLRDDPALARARSMREHRSTLLHYASANGIEDSSEDAAEHR